MEAERKWFWMPLVSNRCTVPQWPAIPSAVWITSHPGPSLEATRATCEHPWQVLTSQRRTQDSDALSLAGILSGPSSPTGLQNIPPTLRGWREREQNRCRDWGCWVPNRDAAIMQRRGLITSSAQTLLQHLAPQAHCDVWLEDYEWRNPDALP